MKNLIVIAALIFSYHVFASEGGHLEPAQTNIRSQESLINGAKLFMNYCSGCHSLKYQRYSRMAQDLGLSKDEVTENLIFTDAKFSSHITKTMDDTQVKAKGWFNNAVPKDLTLVGKSRGPDWLYNYLKSFYKDPSKSTGWNNTVFPDVSMPNVLWQLQGIQQANFKQHKDENGIVTHTFEGFEKLTEGKMSDEEFDDSVRDIANFLAYTAEPAQLIRMGYAPWVLLFLVVFTFLAFLLKKNYFKDIH
jgi:ubiquinol-cytochrome c reductase cytochrome c1 subunit